MATFIELLYKMTYSNQEGKPGLSYLGAEPTKLQHRTYNFWSNIELILECPSAGWRRAMGDDQFWTRAK